MSKDVYYFIVGDNEAGKIVRGYAEEFEKENLGDIKIVESEKKEVPQLITSRGHYFGAGVIKQVLMSRDKK